MLEYLREEAAGSARKASTVWVSGRERYAFVPTRGAVDTAHRETALVGSCALARGLHDFWIDIDLNYRRPCERCALPSLWRRWGRRLTSFCEWWHVDPVHPHDEDAPRDAHLCRGERHTVGLDIKRHAHVLDERGEFGRAEEFVRHWLGHLAQHRRAVLHDFFHVAHYTAEDLSSEARLR